MCFSLKKVTYGRSEFKYFILFYIFYVFYVFSGIFVILSVSLTIYCPVFMIKCLGPEQKSR